MATARRQLTIVLTNTEALTQSIDNRRAPLTLEIREIVRRAESAPPSQAEVAQSTETRRNLESAVTRVKQLSTALVPLGEQGVAVDVARSTLVAWRNALTQRATMAGRYLLLRVLVLVLAIAVVLAVSEVWRRATFRYLRDGRRRRQFLLIRRIVVACAITAVLVVGFVSQIGSLATYAGFVTAGVAVALQNVILAIVAYFFLIGRYGVRVGDRITIGGVTGNVIEIGLVRIYLMELAMPDWHPTGRIVVFSNAVLFQPAALFKQMPGVDYTWHTVTLTLAPTADLARAERDLRAAVDAAYEGFRESIERQHARFQESLDLQTPAPKPEVRIRFADEGVLVLVRYPAELTRANEMDNRVMTAVRDTVTKAPAIPLAPTGSPRLQADVPPAAL
jgi:small-conductance mechanosensitive channel